MWAILTEVKEWKNFTIEDICSKWTKERVWAKFMSEFDELEQYGINVKINESWIHNITIIEVYQKKNDKLIARIVLSE